MGTAEFEAWFAGPQAAYVDSATLGWWSSLRRGVRRPDGPTPYYLWQTKLLNGLYRDGAQLMLGTDTGNPLMVPGFAVHAELQALVNDAGLSTFDALATATVNVGRHLGDKTGTITVGAPADLILADANPLQDLRVLQRPAGVMVRGRWLNREQLDTLLAGAR